MDRGRGNGIGKSLKQRETFRDRWEVRLSSCKIPKICSGSVGRCGGCLRFCEISKKQISLEKGSAKAAIVYNEYPEKG